MSWFARFFADDDAAFATLSTMITSFANFTVQYNFSCVSLALIMMSQGNCTSDDGNCATGEQAAWVEGASEAGIFVGAVIGEICFGYLGDYFGRSEAMILAMSLAFVSIFISSFLSLGSPDAVYAIIILFRFVAGIGLGGMFPLAATKASEDGSHHAGKVNSQASSFSFFWQLPALLLPYILGIIAVDSSLGANARWRLILGFGLIPCFFTLVGLFLERPLLAKRAQRRAAEASSTVIAMHSRTASSGAAATPADDIVVGHETTKRMSAASAFGSPFASHSELTVAQVVHLLRTQPTLRRNLLAAGGSWFLYDVVVYGLGLLSTYTIAAITDDDGNISSTKSVRVLCTDQLIALSAIIPATMLSIYLVPLMGLRNLQMLGFLVQGLSCLLIAASFTSLNHAYPKVLFGLYVVVYATLNFGSGITTFALPAALFPKEIRTTFNGLAAAMGKVGAVVSTFSFYLIAESAGFPALLGICAGIALFAVWFTWALVDPTQLLSEDTDATDATTGSTSTTGTGAGAGDDSTTTTTQSALHAQRIV